ncbi:MAG: hypothetical protein Q4F95_16275 [Oscillospiraceae bacterium]|nr:hypothetical protein [Oscillospiraceae bacterium]
MKEFDVPGFTYFKEKNIFSGSKNTVFNYKIWPGERFKVTVWQGKNCIDKTPEQDIIDTQEFEFTKEGLEELLMWIKGKSDEFFTAHKQ